MIRWIHNNLRPIIAFTHDACMAAASFVLALFLRLGEDQFPQSNDYLLSATVLFAAICAISFISMRLYRGLWRYASLPDMIALVKAVSVAIAAFSIVMFFATRLEGIPRSLPIINWLLLIAMMGGPRFAYRAIKDRTLHFHFRHDASKQIPLLLIGATDSAERFIRHCQRDDTAPYRPVGILDNNAAQHNRSIHSVRIYGDLDILPVVVRKLERKGLKPSRAVLCDDTLSGETVSALLEACEKCDVTLARMPDASELREGIANGRQDIRPIAIEDLLGRAQHPYDAQSVATLVEGKRVVVTGAGGSIGSELCRQIAALAPAALMLIELSEHALYEIDLELQQKFPLIPREAMLADVRNSQSMHALFAKFSPALVFHAAALKHVPLSECNALAAIETNVMGTQHICRAATSCNAEAVVLISTDKAVNPANVMGATKRLAERVCQAASSHGATRFSTVRFGNVLGSTGSVVPLFTKQLARGGPLTVTHPDMVRYFMTIREAVQLVITSAQLSAAKEGPKSAIYVLDMGKPVRITDLAIQMIRLAGLKPGKDVEITYTGLRAGEKLFEELFYDAEAITRTSHAGILITKSGEVDTSSLQAALENLNALCKQGKEAEALTLLSSLVPEYQSRPQVQAA